MNSNCNFFAALLALTFLMGTAGASIQRPISEKWGMIKCKTEPERCEMIYQKHLLEQKIKNFEK